VTKTETTTIDMLTVRLLSYFTKVSARDEKNVGQIGSVHCWSEHLNFPQTLHALLLFECSAPGVCMVLSILFQQPLFRSLLFHRVTGAMRLFKRRTETETNARFVADLSRIGMDLINGDRACRPYGFRRGGAQALIEATGIIEQVMGLGGWTTSSNSFWRYITSLNIRGTLCSTLRSFQKNEVFQVIVQVMATNAKWTSSVVRDVCRLATGAAGVLDYETVAAI